MNKGFRGILIAGAIALLAGFGLVVAGIVAGASWSDVGSVIFSGKYSIGPSTNWGWKTGATEVESGDKLDEESNILKDIDARAIEKLTIEMSAGELKVKEGNSEYFQIVNQEKTGDCYISHDEEELTITVRGKYGNNTGAKTTVWLPKGFEADELMIHTDAGKVQTENLKATTLKLSVGAGQIRTEAISASDVNIEVDAGEFRGSGKITTERAELKVAAGGLRVDLLEAEDADVKVDVGHINVKFVGNQDDYNIDAECDVGEMRIGGQKYYLGKEYQSKNSNANKTIQVECNVGQAIVDFEN